MQTYILSGWGFNVGQDFTRASKDMPIEVTDEYSGSASDVIGYIAGDPNSKLGFMRASKIRVRVQKRALLTA